MEEYLIMVHKNDNQCGRMEKQLTHQLGLLHRAFSVFIFNSKGELLLQQRADEKYHSPGLWTNTCCRHPHFSEDIADSMNRRLMEEMGMHCKTKFAFSFIYKVKFENELTEHEFDHVYFGVSDAIPIPEKSEVKAWKYISLQSLEKDIRQHPEIYTEWMNICLHQVQKHFDVYLKNAL